MTNTGFLSEVKQVVLKPGLNYYPNLTRGTSRTNKLLSQTPHFVDLNIHVCLPLSGVLERAELPTARTLSVATNKERPVYDATSVIRACPRVTLVHLNLNGQPILRSHPECRRALEAAAALGSLRALELVRFSSLSSCRGFSLDDVIGWVPDDLKAIMKYFPGISSLALYGSLGYDEKRHGQFRTSDLLIECSRITNLKSLTMTSDPVYGYCDGYIDSFPLFMSQDEVDDETIWSDEGNESPVYGAVDRAFETCKNLREVSYALGPQGRNWFTVCADQAARGADPEVLKMHDFVNRKHTSREKGAGYIKRRWF